MSVRATYLAAALALAFATHANAGLVGGSYDFSTSVTGNTGISPLGGPTTHTASVDANGNPNFCVGQPLNCFTAGGGLTGRFSFEDVNSTLSTITFFFFGSSNPDRTGTFVINLGNFSNLGGDTIAGITHASGNLVNGDFTSVAWDGTTATFTGSPGRDSSGVSGVRYGATGGATVVFNVALTAAAVPEPSSLALLGIAVLGFGVARRRFNCAV